MANPPMMSTPSIRRSLPGATLRQLDRRTLLRWACAVFGGAIFSEGLKSYAESGGKLLRRPGEGGRSSAARQEAIARIPLGELSPAWQTRVLEVVNHAALFQVMNSPIIECEPEFYRFLVEHPEVIVGMWQALGITKLKLEALGEKQYRLDDSAGTVAQVVYIYTGSTQHVAYAEGTYSAPLLIRPVRGKAVVVLNSSYLREAQGTPYVSASLDLYVHVEQAGVELLTRTLHPLLGSMTETNYQQTMLFVGSVYRTAKLRPVTLRRLTEDLDRVDAHTRQELAEWITRINGSEEDKQTRSAMTNLPPLMEQESLRPERILRQ